MKKKIGIILALSMACMFPVNVSAKQTKTDQMMNLIKKGQIKKAWKINKTLPKYYRFPSLSKKVMEAYNKKIRQMNSSDLNYKYTSYSLCDLTGDHIPKLFLKYGNYPASQRIVVYSYSTPTKVKKIGDFLIGRKYIVVSQGTHHFYVCDPFDSYVAYIDKYTYKNGKLTKKKFANYHWRKNGDEGWMLNNTLDEKTL